MRQPKAMSLLFLLLIFLSPVRAVMAQTEITTLQPGETVERTIARGKFHSFSLKMESDQLLQLVVDQQGIDVVVRLFSPGGKSLGQFDSPNGTEGPENVSLVTDAAGVYRIVVAPLEHEENEASGRYVIRVKELRPATEEELETVKNRGAVKLKAVALLSEAAGSLHTIRLPETRVRLQVQAAQLLWDLDERLARKLMDEAIEGVKQYLEEVSTDDQNYYQSYHTAIQLRTEVMTALTPRDPELALSFLRSTRVLADPNADRGQQDQELQLELSLANQIVAKDSKRALRVAQESLKKGYSYGLIGILSTLQTTDPEAAVKLAGEIAAKLQTEDLLKNQEVANLLTSFLQIARPVASTSETHTTAEAPRRGLLSEQEYKALFNKALSAALGYTLPSANYYSVERSSAQNILNNLKNMSSELEQYAPGRAAAVVKKATDLEGPGDPQSRLWQKYHETITSASFEAALEEIEKAPQEMRGQLYEQLAQRAYGAGDVARARQILTDYIPNPFRRRQALKNLEHQAIYSTLNSGKLDDALRGLANLATPKERAMMLAQIVNRLGMNQKKEAVLKLLAQAREMITTSDRAEDQEQMTALFEIARTYLRFEPKRGFEIVEPLVGQFNEMSGAAATLNGFGQQYLRGGELIMQNGNALGIIAGQLSLTLAALSVADFDRAKATADRVERPEVRLNAHVAIAQSAISQRFNETAGFVIGMRR